MDKESKYELQKIDCNCNDCFYLKRDLDKFNYWKNKDIEFQKQDFEKWKEKAIMEAKAIPNPKEKEGLLNKAHKMSFQYMNNQNIHYGFCELKQIDISFIPDVCQLETQKCFKHRKDI